MKQTLTHKKTLINLMREQGEITAGQVYGISNANQYLGELFKSGVAKWRFVTDNQRHTRFKMWSIKDETKADKFLSNIKVQTQTATQKKSSKDL